MARIAVIGLPELQAQLSALASLSDSDVIDALWPGGEALADGVRVMIDQQQLIDSGALKASVDVEQSDKRTVITKEGPLAYVFAQEFGLPNQQITPRQRAFFWAKFSETGEGMWRALALSATYTIPAKPHFRPGVRGAERDATRAIAAAFTNLIKKRS